MSVTSPVGFPPGPNKNGRRPFSSRTSAAPFFLAGSVLAPAAFGDTITPYGVNNSGLIIGQDFTTSGSYAGFLYNPDTGTFTFLRPPGATNTIAIGINDSNQIVGDYGNSSGNYGYAYSGGTFSTISVPSGNISPPYLYSGGTGTQASGVNDNGAIAGAWNPTASGPQEGFIYNGTAFTNTAILDGGASTEVFGINDSGEISGYTVSGSGPSRVLSGFVYSGGVFTAIDHPGASSTIVQGINDSGDVVGWHDLNGVSTGFVYSGGTFTSITYPGANATMLFGISNNGEIAGDYSCTSGSCPFSDPAFTRHRSQVAGIRSRRFWLPHRNPARSRCLAWD